MLLVAIVFMPDHFKGQLAGCLAFTKNIWKENCFVKN